VVSVSIHERSNFDGIKGLSLANSRVVRFKKKFHERVLADINACLREHQVVGATILLCCAIDCLARYYSGDPIARLNKNKYLDFLNRYFSPVYDSAKFYAFVRCGLVHGYSMEGKYVILVQIGLNSSTV